MTKSSLKTVLAWGGAGPVIYAVLGVNLAQAGIAGPAPLVGVAGGPLGLLAVGVVLGGYLALKHFRNRS
jgi:hypothetical protein